MSEERKKNKQRLLSNSMQIGSSNLSKGWESWRKNEKNVFLIQKSYFSIPLYPLGI